MRRPVEIPPGPAALRYRRMRAEDLSRVVEIEKDGFRHPWSRELLERELSHAWSTVLLAIEDRPAALRQAQGDRVEVVVGFIVFWLVHDEVHVLNIATAREERRRGIGRALMEEAAEAGRRQGATLATLEVRRSNQAAIALYRVLGYRQVGVRPNYYAEEGEDAIVMVLDL
jgi:ribosomal-protein-alanine N-acetyltransferase